jgi:hypothetical protein
VNDSLQASSQALKSSYRVENADLWKRYVDFKFDLQKKLGGPDGKKADENSSLDTVHKQLKDLTKWPCKFFQKGSCRFADNCRFSHNANALQLSNLSLSAGRRLPADELDDQANEHFMWFPCNKRESNALSKGKFRKEGETVFYTSLRDALQNVQGEDQIKYAMLCRVICGVPGSDCNIQSDTDPAQVQICNPAQVYPEYILELFSEDDDANVSASRSGLIEVSASQLELASEHSDAKDELLQESVSIALDREKSEEAKYSPSWAPDLKLENSKKFEESEQLGDEESESDQLGVL